MVTPPESLLQYLRGEAHDALPQSVHDRLPLPRDAYSSEVLRLCLPLRLLHLQDLLSLGLLRRCSAQALGCRLYAREKEGWEGGGEHVLKKEIKALLLPFSLNHMLCLRLVGSTDVHVLGCS